MPILNVVVAPEVSWIDVVDSCSHYGVPCAFFVSRGKSLRHDPVQSASWYLGPLRVVYVEEVNAFRSSHILARLEKNPNFQYLVVVGQPASKFKGVPVYEGSVRSLVAAHFEIVTTCGSVEVDFQVYDHHAEAMKRYARDSVLTRVSQLLYRIKDKVKRADVALSVYKFLSGGRARPPETGIVQLDDVLKSDVAKRYNDAGKCIRKGSPIDFEARTKRVDRFEIGYCIRKSTTDSDLLEFIAFKD